MSRYVVRLPAPAIVIAPIVVLTIAPLASARLATPLAQTNVAVSSGNAAGNGANSGSGSSSTPSIISAAQNKTAVSLGDDAGKSGTNWGVVPPTHTVKRGDTLWDICDTYFHNPWEWPRVWSYNPDILNPHWIYPGELVRLKKSSGGGGGVSYSLEGEPGNPAIVKPKAVSPGTVFLRDYGFLYDDQVQDAGDIAGSPSDRMLLTTYDKVYVRLSDKQAKELSPGDALTVFQSARAVKNGSSEIGKVVQILGTVKIDKIDKDTKLAEGTIVEALDVVERGARVGPVDRRMNVVAPSTNAQDLRGTILASIHPLIVYGQNQVVLVDKGEDQGLRPGNRLFVVRRGDAWRKGLSAGGELSASSVTLNTDSPTTVEKQKFDTPEDSPDYPEEVIAEIRVLRTRKGSAECLVTTSTKELEPGDVWVGKKGY